MFSGWADVLFIRDGKKGPEEFRRVDQFREVRNATVHSLSVIAAHDAGNAVKFIEKDWDNLLNLWVTLLNRHGDNRIDTAPFVDAATLERAAKQPGDCRFALPAWDTLLSEAACDIDFLPVFHYSQT
jgi:hypothetical protein